MSLLFSLYNAALLHQHCRNGQAVQQWAEAIITLATEQAVPYWLTLGTMYHGWALAAQGQMEAGIAQMQQGLAAYRATGARFGLDRWLGLLAELHGRAGQVDAGLHGAGGGIRCGTPGRAVGLRGRALPHSGGPPAADGHSAPGGRGRSEFAPGPGHRPAAAGQVPTSCAPR